MTSPVYINHDTYLKGLAMTMGPNWQWLYRPRKLIELVSDNFVYHIYNEICSNQLSVALFQKYLLSFQQ